ncbi:TonB-dependent receptor [Aliifodinibius sp. S!AR15-10]|uniref:TonB-dependent receptor n=1 Tax=Aliifodinibius sp. S!AR15-10 TaxID=2950437 RepID=UPI002857D78C|nr:TonB-dependent receptor [Aliifodinibius sp. S!AR15-10]MDR8391194.1 TonB-dependent receptor [Aliifodinibius sp. S!AR15-10]
MNRLIQLWSSILLLLLISATTGFAQQTGSLEGTILDKKTGEPLAGVNVGIQDTRKGSSTDTEGFFSIESVSPGNYTLLISAVGYTGQQVEVNVQKSQTTTVDIALESTFLELAEVEITGRSEQSYKNDYSFAATKTATLSKNIPQAISVVTKELLDDQQVYRLAETAKNISGMNQFSGYNDLVLRGFRSGSGNDRLLNGLRVGFGFWNQPLTPHLERIEVIKGPASALFANTNPGGTVNMVTKKPLEISKQSLSFTTGSFNTYRATADFTGPMNDERSLLYRMNIGYEDAESFRTLQFNESYLVAPSVSFIPNSNTRVNVDLVYSYNKTRLDRGQPIFNQSDNLTSTPVEFSLSQPTDYQNLTDFYVTASLSHSFSENLSFNMSYLKFKYYENLEEHRTSNAFLPDDPTILQLAYIRRQQEQFTNNLTSYFVGKLKTGIVQHKALLGFDYIQVDDNRTQIGARGDEFFITDGDTLQGGGVGNFDLENPTYTIERNPETYSANWFSQPWLTNPVRTYTYGIYIQDQMKIGERLQMLLGLRQEFYTNRLNNDDGTFEHIDQNTLLPRVGAVFSITDQINAYGTYTEGFQPQDASIIQDPELYGGPFDPLTSRMVEGGFKAELFNNRLLANLALYHITQNNILVNANDQANPNLLEQRGQEQSQGIEIDMSGSITRNFSVNANYAYNVAKITESDDPQMIGNIKENAPRHQGGIWTKYMIAEGAFNGVGFSLGANFVTERNTFEESLQLPGYTVFDAAAYYRIDRFKLSLNINNLFDETYWEGGYNYGRLYPGEPRHFLANISYSF